MGLVHRGIPEKFALSLAKRYKIRYFIETGTHMGKTAQWATRYFEYVFTIELNRDRCVAARAKYNYLGNINFLMGDSRVLLSAALLAVPGRSLIWLDAHWSKDLGYARPPEGECPVIDEIKAVVVHNREDIVLIDDARYFVDRPARPHRESEWPTYEQIKKEFAPLWNVTHRKDLDILVALPVE